MRALRILKLFTLALAASCALATCVAAQARQKPNIIFILADDLGYGEVGCYGQQKIRTPRLDRMAWEGTRFTQFYAGSTVCAPSRAVLMTGLHTGHARVRKNDYGLYDEDITVAEVLKAAGYRTGIVGKWGLGDPDNPGVTWKQGFDYTFGFLNQKHAQVLFPDYLWRNDKPVSLAHGEYANDLFTEEALSFVRREREQPFFLYLAYTIPHSNSDLARLTGDGMQVPSYAPYEKENWPEPAKGKAAMITRMDRDIGLLLDLLKELKLDEQTLVLFTSDNGASSDPLPQKPGLPFLSVEYFRSNGSLRGEKRDLYEGGIRVPMIARWPGRVQAGATSEQVWAMWDFLPTAAEIAGAAAPPQLDGISMLNALTGKPQRQHEYLYWEYGEGKIKMRQAARMGDWKAVRTEPGAPLELYDLQRDAGEQRNLASEQPELIKKIEALLTGARTEVTNNIKLRTAPALTDPSSALSPVPMLPRLQVSVDGHSLVTADGRPFFWLGDTAWSLFSKLTLDEAAVYLRDRRANRFTVIQAHLLDGDLDAPQRGRSRCFDDNDFDRPSEAYWRQVDAVINEAERQGLYLALLPAWARSYIEAKDAPLTDPAKAYRYAKFLGARYRDRTHLVWVLGGDRRPTRHEVYDALARGLADGAANGDPSKILISYHPPGGTNRPPATSTGEFYHDRPWLDFNLIQSGHRVGNKNYERIA